MQKNAHVKPTYSKNQRYNIRASLKKAGRTNDKELLCNQGARPQTFFVYDKFEQRIVARNNPLFRHFFVFNKLYIA